MNKEIAQKVNFINRLKNSKKLQYIVVAIVLAVITLIFALNFIKKDEKVCLSDDVSVYVKNLEDRLSETLSYVKGVGKVSVLIKVDGGMETLLATKTVKTEVGGKTETEQTPILVNGKTVVLKEVYPKILGVIIVAEGADSIVVMRKIQEATVSFLNIDLNKIEILSMK